MHNPPSPYRNKTVQELIGLISAHDDQNAFRLLFDLYYPKLVSIASCILSSSFNAEEVVSTVFVKIWEQRKELPGIRKLNSYLYVMVKNACYNYLRDNRRFAKQSLAFSDHNELETTENPEVKFLRSELRNEILDAVNQLPPRCKLIFSLIREDGMKYKEVAGLLDISVNTVEVQMSKAIARLKEAVLPLAKDNNITIPKLNTVK